MAGVALAAAAFLGEASLVPIGVPFGVALVIGLRVVGSIPVHVKMDVVHDQVLEGDLVTGTLRLDWPGTFDAQVLIDRLGPLEAAPDFDPYSWKPGADSVELPVRLVASRWGRHATGEVWVRLTLPMGLLSWTGRVLVGPAVRVLPGTERLTQLLPPTRSRTVWGAHTTARLGDGHDFAELRPYGPGDRLRDLNWAATARTGEPIVNRYHSEVSGDVMIALEPYHDGSSTGSDVLERAARLSWAIASLHMGANDRVGLAGMGRSAQWLPPAGGRLARYRLLDTLLRVGGEAAEGVLTPRRWVDMPPTALVIAITTLAEEDTLWTLIAWRRLGRALAVVVLDPGAAFLDADEAPERLAARLWNYELEHRMARLRSLGVSVVRAPMGSGAQAVVSALRQTHRGFAERRR